LSGACLERSSMESYPFLGGGRMLVEEGAFTRGGAQSCEEGALLVEEASSIGWRITHMVEACSRAIEGAFMSEGASI
jgi:hypothetical protein